MSNKLLQKEIQTKLQQKKLKTNEIKHFNFKKNIDCLTVKTFSPSFVEVEYVAYTKAAEYYDDLNLFIAKRHTKCSYILKTNESVYEYGQEKKRKIRKIPAIPRVIK